MCKVVMQLLNNITLLPCINKDIYGKIYHIKQKLCFEA